MQYTLENLGPKAFGNLWRAWRMVRDPHTNLQYVMGALTRTGFALIDPRTKSSRVIRCEGGMNCAEGIGQTPNGDLYVADYGFPLREPTLCRWDWKSDTAKVVAIHPGKGIMHLDCGNDGHVYLPDYQTNTLYRYRHDTGKIDTAATFHELSNYCRNIESGRDGLLYIQLFANKPAIGFIPSIIAFDPRSGKKIQIDTSAVAPSVVDEYSLMKDAQGRVLLSTFHWGNRVWHELRDAKLHRIDQSMIALNNMAAMAFDDGSYIAGVDGNVVTLVDSERKSSTFTIDREEAPLRIFSIESGGGKIWLGTFMPLTLASFDPKTGESKGYGNVTRTEGEPYSMVYSNHKLFMACYVNAHVVRFDPHAPINKNDTIQSNPGTLGLMKPQGLPVHRPHGKTMAPDGTVFFAALGGYGCIDSAVARVDPKTDRMTTWTLSNTEVTAIAYHPGTHSLLIAERRVDEKWLRITRLSPVDGKEIETTPIIEDGGTIHSLLIDGDVVYGMHGWRATLFAYDLRKRKITASLPEMRVGTHLHNCLVNAPDGRILGATTSAVFAVTRDLLQVEVLGEYPETFQDSGNRFGACFDDAGNLYFPNGINLMRLKIT